MLHDHLPTLLAFIDAAESGKLGPLHHAGWALKLAPLTRDYVRVGMVVAAYGAWVGWNYASDTPSESFPAEDVRKGLAGMFDDAVERAISWDLPHGAAMDLLRAELRRWAASERLEMEIETMEAA